MRALLKLCFSAGLLSAVLFLAGCKGKQGDPGPAGNNGTNGTNGTNGANGTNGINGTNGVGFEQAVKNGNILIYLDGKTPAGVAFKDTLDYKFSSSDLSNSAVDSVSPTDIRFTLQRFLIFDNYTLDDYINLNLRILVDTVKIVLFGRGAK